MKLKSESPSQFPNIFNDNSCRFGEYIFTSSGQEIANQNKSNTRID